VIVIRRLVTAFSRSSRAVFLLVALLVVAVAVPVALAASRSSSRSHQRVYDAVVSVDRPVARASRAGRSSDVGLLSVASRSILASAEASSARSLELWARPRVAGRRGRLRLSWGATRVRFAAVLPARRFTHVVVGWSEEAIRLFFDGNLVETQSLGAPSEVGGAHRFTLLGRVSRLGAQDVALYGQGLQLRDVRRHFRAGAALFGRLAPIAVRRSGGVVAHAAAVPANTALPAITGTVKDGQTVTSSNGTWSGSPTSYTRAWQRCDSAGANCAAISGATATTYLVGSADVGKTIRVKVTATNASGSGNATSAATALVTAAAPVNTAVPAVTGTAKDGQTLTSTTGTWTGTTPLSYARQWRRCDTAGANCTDISGATATTYVLTGSEVGKTIRVVITASNTAGNVAATSTASATVTTAAPVNTAVPSIAGTAKEGQLLTASTGTWTGSATITYSYAWQSCNSAGASCVAISGATLSSYRVASTDVSKTLKVIVTAANGAGSASASSAVTAAITTGVPVSVTAPTVTGTAKDGQTLTTANGTWAGTATITYTRQWKRCNSAGASCTAISGATATTYALTAADVGFTIRASWTATNGVGSATADTAPTVVIAAQPPANTTLPAVTGTAKEGQTLTATNGTWTGSATITYTKQWKRCDTGGSSCTAISGATAATYVATSADISGTLRVTVTATNGAGSITADSAPTPTVTGSAPANAALPAITGTTKDGQTLTSSAGTWSGSSPITYARQWQRCNSAGASCTAIAGETNATYVLTATDVAKRIRVTVTATNAAGNATATSAASATVTANAPVNTTAPQIVGTAKENFYVYTTSGTWSGSGPFTYTYQWQQCDAAGTNCTNIDGRVYDGMDLLSDYLGLTVRVLVTATNSAGSATTASTATAPITNSPPVLNRAAIVALDAGTLPFGDTDANIPIWGSTFGQVESTWYGTQPITVTYQWLRCDDQGANCTDIPGATSKRYKTTLTDLDKRLRIRITATNSLGSSTVTTEAGTKISDGQPTNTEPPTLSGTARNHYTLTASPGAWAGPLPYSSAYVWQRCDADGENCEPTDAPNSADYDVVDADVGHRIKADVSAVTAKADNTMQVLSAVVVPGSAKPTVTLGGDLVDDPEQWLGGDSYTLTVGAEAADDTGGVASVAVILAGEKIAEWGGCGAPSCSVDHSIDVDLSEKNEGALPLIVVAVDEDHTETIERREVRVDRGAPGAPQHLLVDQAADGTAMITWQASNSTDAHQYEVLRRRSPDDPFTVIGMTSDHYLEDTDAGAASPLARMTSAGLGVSEEASVDDGYAEYQVRTLDQAGQASEPSAPAEASATETPIPAPTQLQVQQTSASAPTQLTWDASPGAERYAVFRALDYPSDLAGPPYPGQVQGTPELIADVPADVTDVTDAPGVNAHFTYTVRAVMHGQLSEMSPQTGADLQATKIPMSQDGLDHAQEIAAALEAQGAPAREPMDCNATCEHLRAGIVSLPGAGAFGRNITDDLYKLGTKLRVLPAIERLGLQAARRSPQVIAFGIGFAVGTKIRQSYLDYSEPPPAPSVEIGNWKLTHRNSLLRQWVCNYNWEGTACTGMGTFFVQGEILAPSLGAVGLAPDGIPIARDSWTSACSTPEMPVPQEMPGGWHWLRQLGPCHAMWGQTAFYYVPFRFGHIGPPAPGPSVPGVGDGVVDNPGRPLSETEAVQTLLDELRDHSDEYSALIPWLEQQLGIRTASTTPDGTPFCGGKTYEACVSAFKHAGFAGPFTKKVLNPDEAWIGQPGGAVIDTTPWADDTIDAQEDAVEIEVNPSPMPDWTSEDEEVDQHIKDLNPIPDNEWMGVEDLRKNAARRCRIRIQRTSLPLSDCWTMPIMVTGGLDAYGPAKNDVLALARKPRWVAVNRRPSTPKKRWYLNRAAPAPGCVQVPTDAGPRAPAGMACDEYPMWQMAQGYEGDLQTDIPNIAWTSSVENSRQGTVLSQFYSNNNPGESMLFHGCDIVVTPARAVGDPTPPDAVPPTFLAIPIPVRLMPSFGVCNRQAS
jgi:hypothetical protein